MHDLRKKVLVQSGKTQSRKARARENPKVESSDPADSSNQSPGSSARASPNSSRAGSRTNSRPGSRYASEDEGELDDLDEFYDDEFDPNDDGLEKREWMARLRVRITQLQDYRKTSLSEREITNTAYSHLLRNYIAWDQIDENIVNGVIFPALLNSIERGASEKEVWNAINGFSATLVTCPSETAFDRASKALKLVCEESEHKKVKVAAMNALVVALGFEGGMQPDIEEVLEFLLGIIESDGQSVGAEDNGTVVSGALQAWGCAASYHKNLAEATEDGRAMEAFLEQLDSTNADVQISAGYNIAHLFEVARKSSGSSETDLQHTQHIALTRMHEIVKHWTKRTAKKDRRALRDEFPSIIISIEEAVGPGYVYNSGRIGLDEDEFTRSKGGNVLGDLPHLGLTRKKRIMEEKETPWKLVDSWKYHARLEILKQVLLGGMDLHWEYNPVVRSALTKPTTVPIIWQPRMRSPFYYQDLQECDFDVDDVDEE